MASGDTKTQQYLDVAANGTRADLPAETCCETRTQSLIRGVAERIMDVEDEVERLENNPDVVDIVATYADLQGYDTSQLTDKDVIRVLQDETHNDESTYYRWSATAQSWTYIGGSKQYTDFVGTDGTTAGTNGLVPAPATTDAGKFLKADGTWDTAGSAVNVVQTTGTSTEDVMSQKAVTDALATAGPTVVQTTGTSTEDVMSQNATTGMIYADPATKENVAIGSEQSVSAGYRSVVLGKYAALYQRATDAICIGSQASTVTNGTVVGSSASAGVGNAVAIGVGAWAQSNVAANPAEGAVAVGAFAYATKKGQFDISTMSSPVGRTLGYNNSQYRLLTGLYDPQSAHDAATKGYVDTQIGTINTALQTLLNGTGA